MKDPRTRWKATGVAAGTAALMTAIPVSSAQAMPATHFAPDAAGLSVAQEVSLARTAEQQLRLRVLEEGYLASFGRAVSTLEARAALLGSPSTLTPRQAGKFRSALGATSFVQHRLAALAAVGSDTLTPTDLATLASLRNRANAVKTALRTALSAATIVHPDAAKLREASLVKQFAARDADGDGHVCDGDHDGFRNSFRSGSWDGHRDGDRNGFRG
jgi:hypothetical protein